MDRNQSVQAYPLAWPEGWPRTGETERKRANFNSRKDTGASYRYKRSLSVAEGLCRVLEALGKMGVPSWNVIISTDMPVRQDGRPYSGRRDPENPGAAVYWREGDDENSPRRSMAIDQYDRLADNLAAIAATLDAMRGIERWGGAEILNRAFQGFLALPERVETGWWNVLGVAQDADADVVEQAYKVRRSRTHPDKPDGSESAFLAVQSAWQQFQAARLNHP